MNILIAHYTKIPAVKYGGTERVIADLGRALTQMGHKVFFMVEAGSYCDFATVLPIEPGKPVEQQVPNFIDVVHFHFRPKTFTQKPYIVTAHGNAWPGEMLDKNTVFVSKNHAERHNSNCFVYNGLHWQGYGAVRRNNTRKYFHFLGDAAWRVKNVKGAIKVITHTPAERLMVLGGNRLNFRMGFRLTFSPRISFAGMVGGNKKLELLQQSKGLIFPVRWHEPFGLAIIESLYMGCPVFGTPYGSLPEIVHPSVGYLCTNSLEMAKAVLQTDSYDRVVCHEYSADNFNALNMAKAYVKKYEQVLNGVPLHNHHPAATAVAPKFLEWQ